MTENPSIEPSVRLPRQVIRAGERARALLTKPSVPTDADPTPAEKADAAAPATETTTPPPPADVPRDPRENDPAYWRQRFNVTDGMWKAERRKHAETVQTKDAEIQRLTAEVARLQQQQAPAQVDLTKYLTAEEIEALGEDQARTMVSMAERLVADRVRAEIDAKVPALPAAAPAPAGPSKAELFIEALDEQVPTWRDINEDARWLKFLTERDDATGMRRQSIVDAAQQDGDATPVVNLLRQFIAAMNPVPVNPQPSVVPNGTAAGASPQQAAASVSTAGAPTAAEIREFYKNRALGKISDEQARAFEARVKTAQAAGLL